MTVSKELRDLGTAEALLDLTVNGRVSAARKSVGESVIIFLLGHNKCYAIDKLLEMNVVGEYCIPILKCALQSTEFRSMYPHLVYSVKLFHVLAQSPEYAKAAIAH